MDVEDGYDGWCDRPGKPDPSEYPGIRLPKGLPYGNSQAAKDGLINLLHECCHAENWNLSEARCDLIAIDIGTFLWRLGYRRVRQRKRDESGA